MFLSNSKISKYFIKIFLPIIIYIILFEFIIPVNKFFPKASLVYESFFSIFIDYDIITGIAISSTSVYLGIIFSYIFVKLSFTKFIKFDVPSLKSFNYFIPALIVVILWVFWFGSSILAEFLFIILWAIIRLYNKALSSNYSTIVDKINFIRLNNLGIDKINELKSEQLLNILFKDRNLFHFQIWSIAFVYEFIAKTGGLGSNIFQLFANYDLIGIFAITIISSLLIFIGDKILNLAWEKVK